ncbi:MULTISPECIES: GNAT family N-acetyltransferase [Actinosynnema]|uniref:GNAT family N-acetyltransferase n=1 Tax=Actinosynnema TaxID=40566 RepID=UPI0020A3ADA4|nr:GNAT family N-acetyltransferase [Actinosynnema pretiosum]MCP2098944.1 Protein N-acetyltransferase, RimJ/RimL family [Actinosynnema pretiosum]
MTELGPVPWPPDPIRTGRLVLRASEARDRAAVVELFSSPQVGAGIGGPQPPERFDRAVLEREMPEVPGDRPGFLVVELDGAAIGAVTFDRRPAEPGSTRPDGEVGIGYLFLPGVWGRGYATEACAAALDWLARALPGEPVLLCTALDNGRSVRLAARLGFAEVERFRAYGAEQWLGVRVPPPPSR